MSVSILKPQFRKIQKIIFITEFEKIVKRTRITPNTDIFYAVENKHVFNKFGNLGLSLLREEKKLIFQVSKVKTSALIGILKYKIIPKEAKIASF